MSFDCLVLERARGTLSKVDVETSRYTYIAFSAHLACSALLSPDGRQSLIALAHAILNGQDESPELHELNRGKAEEIVHDFLRQIQQTFPPPLIDDDLPKEVIAWYKKPDPPQPVFELRLQFIFLRADRVNDMIEAGRASVDGNVHAREEFKLFLFYFATAIIHELGHILNAFLSDGRKDTPESVSTSKFFAQDKERHAEAGRVLEWELFGGCLEWRENPLKGLRQAGTPCIVGEDHDVSRVSMGAVDSFLDYQFEFPLDFENFTTHLPPIIGGPNSRVALPPARQGGTRTPLLPVNVRPCRIAVHSIRDVPLHPANRARYFEGEA